MQLLPHASHQANLREQESKVDRLFVRLGSLDHYSLLGVPRDAETGLIQRAHTLRRTLYQSLATSAQAPATVAKVRAILSALDLAWEVLGNAARRAEYDLRMTGTPQVSVTSMLPPPPSPEPEVFSRAQRAQEVFSTPSRAPSVPPPPRTPKETPAPAAPRSRTPSPPVGVMPAVVELVMNQAFEKPNVRAEAVRARAETPTIRPPSMPRPTAVNDDEAVAPRAPTHASPAFIGVAPSTRPMRSRLDPWDRTSTTPPSAHEDIATLCSALQATLAVLAEERPHDILVIEARRNVSEMQARHAVREAHEHELRGQWTDASRSWMQASRCMPEDPWALAHAARALLLSNALPSEAVEVARRALALDPDNSLASTVVWRAQG